MYINWLCESYSIYNWRYIYSYFFFVFRGGYQRLIAGLRWAF
ncbi:unnamed protein product [Staurois parvus]|uniref:Uncharacterized protein n=1 Tax=Staurois parvus TaxID=386267 RepID=A0ABN9EWZ5_9NEOB|nr:unnamed protein product [Staurois parvus]